MFLLTGNNAENINDIIKILKAVNFSAATVSKSYFHRMCRIC